MGGHVKLALTLNEANRQELLRLLGEQGTNAINEQAELDYLLQGSSNIYDAASTGWLMKADRLIAQYPLASISLGSESYKFQSISEIMDYCRERSRYYAKLAGKASGIVLAMTPSMGGDTP